MGTRGPEPPQSTVMVLSLLGNCYLEINKSITNDYDNLPQSVAKGDTGARDKDWELEGST